MKAHNKYLVLALIIFLAGCTSEIVVPKDVSYDYNVNFDLSKLKTYDLSPEATTVGIEHLMMERIKTAIHTELAAKNIHRAATRPDFFVTIYGVRSKIFTTVWRGFDSDLIVEKGKLILHFIDPKTNQIVWWGETRAILDPNRNPEVESRMVNDAVQRILQKFPPASS